MERKVQVFTEGFSVKSKQTTQAVCPKCLWQFRKQRRQKTKQFFSWVVRKREREGKRITNSGSCKECVNVSGFLYYFLFVFIGKNTVNIKFLKMGDKRACSWTVRMILILCKYFIMLTQLTIVIIHQKIINLIAKLKQSPLRTRDVTHSKL